MHAQRGLILSEMPLSSLPADQPYDVGRYLELNERLRGGAPLTDSDRAYLEPRVGPGALLSYQGELLEVAEGYVGEAEASASLWLKRHDPDCGGPRRRVLLLTLGLALTRLVASAPVIPASLPELAR
jgi:hypothetical protein